MTKRQSWRRTWEKQENEVEENNDDNDKTRWTLDTNDKMRLTMRTECYGQ